MACQTCGNTKTSWCGNCPPSDSLIAKVDTLPDPFYGDRDHLYLTPQGIIYALAPDRNSWIKVSGDKETIQFPKLSVTGGGNYLTANGYELNASELVQAINVLNNKEDKDTTYTAGSGIAINDLNEISAEVTQAELDNTKQALNERISNVEARTDNYISNVGVSREGNKVKLTYTYVTGQEKEVEFDDKDTITLAYDDTEIKQRLSTIEQKVDNDNQTLSFNESNRELAITKGNSIVIPDKDTTYTQELSGNTLALKGSNGSNSSVQLPEYASKATVEEHNNRISTLENKEDKDTTYSLSLDGDTLSINSSSNTNSKVPLYRDVIEKTFWEGTLNIEKVTYNYQTYNLTYGLLPQAVISNKVGNLADTTFPSNVNIDSNNPFVFKDIEETLYNKTIRIYYRWNIANNGIEETSFIDVPLSNNNNISFTLPYIYVYSLGNIFNYTVKYNLVINRNSSLTYWYIFPKAIVTTQGFTDFINGTPDMSYSVVGYNYNTSAPTSILKTYIIGTNNSYDFLENGIIRTIPDIVPIITKISVIFWRK